ncbi:hypothetical protein BGX20_006430, partial [Mortierella sp. AD010]
MLNTENFLPTPAGIAHFRNAYKYHLIEVLRRYCKSSKRFKNSAPVINKLPVKKTTTYPLSTLRIDESTVEGNRDVLETVMEKVLDLPKEWFNGKQMIVAGDQMTVARLRTLKYQRRSDVSPYARLEWMEPLIQLFHIQMLYSSTIINNYYGDSMAPGSFGFYISLLKRKRVGPVKQDFHAADELLRHSFEGLMMQLWMTEFGCEKLEDLDKLLGEMNSSTLEDKINSGVNNIASVWLDRLRFMTNHNTLSKNSAFFMKDMVLYIELADSIKAGDIGRIEEALKSLTVIFQAGQTKNYALELLHLHCVLNHASDNKRKEAIMSS